jgi:hypothetical protein
MEADFLRLKSGPVFTGVMHPLPPTFSKRHVLPQLSSHPAMGLLKSHCGFLTLSALLRQALLKDTLKMY